MMESGLLDEVSFSASLSTPECIQTVGYSELFDYLKGKSSLEDSISMIKQNTRHYAKRQITWLNKNKNLIWLEDDYFNKILARLRRVKT